MSNYGIQYMAAAETLITIAADSKHIGARIGLASVIHAWCSAITRARRSIGGAVHLMQASLGHSAIVTTRRYLHAGPTESSSKYLAI